jgi:hypothetical protein
MQSYNFTNCCGINILAGFPFDSKDAWTEAKIREAAASIPQQEGTYCRCHLIALNHQQKQAAQYVVDAGYRLVGEFESAHGDGRMVYLYAKGLTVYPPLTPKIAPQKKRAVTKKPRRKAK